MQLIGGLRPYPVYKNSGVEWLDQLPESWDVRRMKTLLRERVERGQPDKPLLAATQSHGVIPKNEYGQRTVVATVDLSQLKLVKKGDFVISLRSFQGGIEYSRAEGIISPAYRVLYPREEGHHAYLAWLFKANVFVDSLQMFVTGIREGQNIDYERLARLGMPVPPQDDQVAIAIFLNHVNVRMQRLIEAKERLIGLLEEERRAIIRRILTGGLDPNAPSTESDISWIRTLPAHWNVRRLKWAFRLQRGYDLPADMRLSGQVPVVSSGGIIGTHAEARAKGPGVVMGRYGFD